MIRAQQIKAVIERRVRRAKRSRGLSASKVTSRRPHAANLVRAAEARDAQAAIANSEVVKGSCEDAS